MRDLKKKFSEGGAKAVVLAAGAILVTGAAEAYRAGDIQTAIALGAIGVVAFLIHEALTQYRFAFADDLRDLIASNVEAIDPADDAVKDDQQ